MAKRYLVKISASAENDILAFRDYIAKDKPRAAEKWAAALVKLILQLNRFPLRCEVIPETDQLDVEYRHLLFGNYRTVFRIEDDQVLVVRVIHASQLLDQSMLRKSTY